MTTRNITPKNILVTGRNQEIKHTQNLSAIEEKAIIRMYKELVPGDDKRPIDIQMIVDEAFPKFEETIGKEAFAKVKKYFGIGSKPNLRTGSEVKCLVSKLRTIENAQYYIVGYKELVKNMASKLLNAPKEMTDLEKAKLIRMFFIVLSNNEIFLEDYVSKTLSNGKDIILFSEEQALANNKLVFGPEELFDIWNLKVKYTNGGYYYDMMVLSFKRMYIDFQMSKNKFKSELSEMLEFAELKYNSQTQSFTSVNKCMPGATFAEIRRLKQKIHQVHAIYPLELFCNEELIKEKIDITDLYVIYKTFAIYPWKTESEVKEQTYKSMNGSRFIDKKQNCYEIFDNFTIADEAEAERWTALFEYLAEHELVLNTEFDGNGKKLSKTESYNVGALSAALNFAMEMSYINLTSMVISDFEVAKKLLSLEDAEEKFLKLKRDELKMEDMREILGIDDEFENSIIHIKTVDENMNSYTPETMPNEEQTIDVEEDNVENLLVHKVIKFALDNGYAEKEENINISLIENVFIPGNEENIKKFSKGDISESEFKKRIGFEVDFAEAYFDTSKFDIKVVEAKLQELKRCGKKDQVRKSKLLVSMYCYLVKNGIGCGMKNKAAKRNKGLKPEILEKLVS